MARSAWRSWGARVRSVAWGGSVGWRVFDVGSVGGGGAGAGWIFLGGVVCAVCLLPAAILMGATLPGISWWVEVNPRGVCWLGFFYGGNTGGPVVGCLLAGF